MQAVLRGRQRFIRAVDARLLLLILAFVATATAYNLLIPPYENLDELEHAEVVRHIAVTGRLPIHDEAEAAGFHVRQEASQPPLYHTLGAGLSRLLALSTEPHRPTPVPSKMVACGETATFYNKATWIRDPYATAVSWSGATVTVRVLRAFSTVLQIFTLVGVWTLARQVNAKGPLPALATAIVAFNPQFLLLAADVSNDNAVIPLATWGLVLSIRMWQHDLRVRRTLVFAAVAGLAALSKLSGMAVLGLGGLALLIRLLQGRAALPATVVHGALILLVVAAIVAPWLLRNSALYGDPTALSPMLDKVGRREVPPGLGEARLMWLSYWGQLPCTFYPRAFYWPYLIVALGGALGLLFAWRHLGVRRRIVLGICLVWFTVITLAWLRWDSMTPAPGGRLLFPAAAAVAVILATGWSALGRRATKVTAAAMPILALVGLMVGPGTILAPPRTQESPDSPAVTSPIDFGNQVSLHSYRANIRDAGVHCVLVSSAYCQPALDLKLTWQAQTPMTRDLTMVVQLVSAAPGATDLRLNYNYWPGRGNAPTSLWPVGPLLEDHYLLPLPPSEAETQAWRVTLALLDPDSGNRLPVTIDDAAAGDNLTLNTVRVPGRQPDLEEIESLPAPVVYSAPDVENALQLEGAQVHQGDGGTWTVDLLWQAIRPVTVDAITFVHGYDTSGALLAGGDGPPKQGAYPTSLWEPGDRVQSRHLLTFEVDERPHSIAVGLYVAADGSRLPASVEGQPVPDGAYIIWVGEPQ